MSKQLEVKLFSPFNPMQYEKKHVEVLLADGERVICWPNAGVLSSQDGSDRRFGAGTLHRYVDADYARSKFREGADARGVTLMESGNGTN